MKSKKILTALLGMAIGFINGLLGAGGGMIAIPILKKLGFSQKEAHTNAIAIILPITFLSSALYLLKGYVTVKDAFVFSEDINEIGKIIKEKNSKCFYHVDATQAISKVKVDLSNIDLVSFSAHKFFGIKGIGVLIKKEKIMLEPIIHGGKSTTIFRSGTPQLPLIVSMSKALRIALENLEDKYNYVQELNNYLKEELSKLDNVYII